MMDAKGPFFEDRASHKPVRKAVAWNLTVGAVLGLAGWICATSFAADNDEFPVPLGLPPLKYPADNPMTAAKVALGRQLYFDPRLSEDEKVSCASCHDPTKGWTSGAQFSTGVGGQLGGRNGPTILNTAYQQFQFWDGRVATLEEQALGTIQNPAEMNIQLDELERKLNKIEGYREQFRKIFGTDVTRENIAKSLAAFERTVLSGDAPYDRFQAGDKKALSDSAQRGFELFTGKARCSTCHSGPNFTDNAFHNVGIGMDRPEPDTGRRVHSKIKGDHGSFKTPTLREVTRTAPYMHNGSIKSLEDVVEHYNRGGVPNPHLDEEIRPLNLTKEEKADLVRFLTEGLSSTKYPMVAAPKLPQ